METIENIKTDEGYRSEPYLCSAGKLTWLYGRNIEDRPITENEWMLLKAYIEQGNDLKYWAEKLFENNIMAIEMGLCRLYKWHNELTREAQIIIVNMTYNMGRTKFNHEKWPRFFKAVSSKDYKKAAEEMKNSRWYNQVGKRSERLYNAMKRQCNS